MRLGNFGVEGCCWQSIVRHDAGDPLAKPAVFGGLGVGALLDSGLTCRGTAHPECVGGTADHDQIDVVGNLQRGIANVDQGDVHRRAQPFGDRFSDFVGVPEHRLVHDQDLLHGCFLSIRSPLLALPLSVVRGAAADQRPSSRPVARVPGVSYHLKAPEGKDAAAGLLLGLANVPGGLAMGVLAGVSPVSGLYGYLFGTVAGALATSSVLMSVQATAALAVLVSDVPGVDASAAGLTALVTLTVLTGLIMLVLGLAKTGSVVRFVPHSVVTGSSTPWP